MLSFTSHCCDFSLHCDTTNDTSRIFPLNCPASSSLLLPIATAFAWLSPVMTRNYQLQSLRRLFLSVPLGPLCPTDSAAFDDVRLLCCALLVLISFQ